MILIIDFGSQFNQLIARRVRECRVYCQIESPAISVDEISGLAPEGIILSGGPSSIYEKGSPKIDTSVFDAVLRIGKQMPKGFMLSYDSRAGIGWNDPRGWYVSFGPDLDSLNEKLMVYETILKEFIAKNIQPSFISVENLHSPYYRME